MSSCLKAFQKITILAENCVISVITGSICLPPKLLGWIPGYTLWDSSIIFQQFCQLESSWHLGHPQDISFSQSNWNTWLGLSWEPFGWAPCGWRYSVEDGLVWGVDLSGEGRVYTLGCKVETCWNVDSVTLWSVSRPLGLDKVDRRCTKTNREITLPPQRMQEVDKVFEHIDPKCNPRR
ncbi:hypothetical protein DFH08DRAFT_808203 [Mycena albidolilacea]|uniref:Uncharacterized protein n=1 Tax=Mycena albidolilacea TaxID=1033008 RepID=A0AAD7A320_9AGAR|nr:hypothetical protein DFH08DRAFT_808203 [Mycena albidolilacea]